MKSLKYITIILASILITPFTNSLAADNTFNPAQKTEIQQIVHDYLVKHPQVLVEASQALQQQQQAAAEKTALHILPSISNDMFNNPNSPTVGNKNGKITLVEFFDYQCPHCKDMAPIIENISKTNPDLRIVYKELPIFGGNSMFASKAALASVSQNKYSAFHNALMKAKEPLSKDKILKIAKSVGINVNALEKKMKDPKIQQEIKNNYQLASKLKLVGTPAFIIAKTPVTGGSATQQSLNAVFISGTTNENILLQKLNKVRS